MQTGSTTWTNTYNSAGLRTKRTDGTTTYTYYYEEGRLSAIKRNDLNMWIIYDENGPVTIKYGVGTFHYVTNLQGDVVAIVGADGRKLVEYTYDAWGKVTSITGDYAYNLGIHNPILYRGYIYDHETGFYYCQSRYYDPETGRFLNADALVSTGQGMLGNNMFAYCCNNPVNCSDSSGCFSQYIEQKHFDVVGGLSIESIAWNLIRKSYNSIDVPDVAISYGRYISVTVGMFTLTATFETAFDLHGNVQYNSSFGFDITTSGSLSASTGYTGSVFFVPDTSYLAGESYYIGGSKGVPIPYTPIAVAGSANIVQTADGYWGVLGSIGIAPISSNGSEIHGGYSYTHSWTPQINVFDVLGKIIESLT